MIGVTAQPTPSPAQVEKGATEAAPLRVELVLRDSDPRACRYLRDFLDHLADSLLLSAHRDVGLRENPDQPVVLINDGKPPHLIGRHQLQRVREIVVCTNRDGIVSRDFAYRHALRVLLRCDRSDDDVSVCDDAGQRVAIENR